MRLERRIPWTRNFQATPSTTPRCNPPARDAHPSYTYRNRIRRTRTNIPTCHRNTGCCNHTTRSRVRRRPPNPCHNTWLPCYRPSSACGISGRHHNSCCSRSILPNPSRSTLGACSPVRRPESPYPSRCTDGLHTSQGSELCVHAAVRHCNSPDNRDNRHRQARPSNTCSTAPTHPRRNSWSANHTHNQRMANTRCSSLGTPRKLECQRHTCEQCRWE